MKLKHQEMLMASVAEILAVPLDVASLGSGIDAVYAYEAPALAYKLAELRKVFNEIHAAWQA